MTRKILLLLAGSFSLCASAQKTQKNIAYAITGKEKGQHNWTEVRMIDIATGDEIKSVYRSVDEVEAFNARSGKPVKKMDLTLQPTLAKSIRESYQVTSKEDNHSVVVVSKKEVVPVRTDQPFA